MSRALFRWLGSMMLLGAAACASRSPSQSQVSDDRLVVLDPKARSMVDRYEERARSSSDPIAVWLAALSEEKDEVFMAALARTRDSFLNIMAIIVGAKALEILKSALPGETSQDSSDGVNVRQRLLGYIRRIERDPK